jgi:MFS family permease
MTSKSWSILAVLMMAEVVASLESGMVIAGIPRWTQIYGDPVMVGWLISSFLVTQAAAAVLGGRLGDMFGRCRVMIVALLICAAGSVLSGFSSSLEWMIAGRAIQGTAGAIQPLCYGLIREYLPENRMRFAVSMIVAMAAGSSAVGIVVGGYMTDHFGPQAIFLVMSGTASLALLLVTAKLPRDDAPPRPKQIDYLGGILFVPGMILLLMGMSSLEKGAADHMALLLGGSGLAILVGWGLYELRHKAPLIDVRLLAQRDIALANSVMALIALSLMQAGLAISMMIQQPAWTGVGLGGSATFAAWLMFPALVLGMVGSLVTGWLADRVGPKVPMISGCVMAIGALVLVIVAHGSVVPLTIALIVVNVGNIIAYSAVPMVIVGSAPNHRVSEATGFTGVIRSLFRAAGVQLMGVLLMTSTISQPGGPSMPHESAFMLVFGSMIAMTLLALLAAAGIGSGRRVGKEPIPAQDGDPAAARPAGSNS